MSVPEVWLRGQLPDVPKLLQPVAHSLLQSREEVVRVLPQLTPMQIAARPGGVASVGYHVRHAAGSIDRLFTYARGEALSREQLAWLGAENQDDESQGAGARLLSHFDATIERALAQLTGTDETTLLAAREVGRARLASTVLGLLFHAAEHTQRHVGQLVTTARIVVHVEPAKSNS